MTEVKTLKCFCNDCANETKHYVRFDHKTSDSQDVDGGRYTVEWGSHYVFLECCGCSDVAIRRRDWCSEYERGDYVETYFPPRVSRRKPPFFDELPVNYRNLLEEIYAALHVDSRRLALMGARTLIDIFISEKVGDQGSFRGGLNALKEKGYMSDAHKEVVESAVNAGSAAAHRGYDPSTKEVTAVMDIVENLVQHSVLSGSADLLRKSTPPRLPRCGK
jgi:hypothetical protein